MYADTIVLALTGIGNVTVVKVNQDNFGSEYQFRDATHQVIFRIRHTKVTDKVTKLVYDRHNVEIVRTVFASVSELNPRYQKTYFVWETLPSDQSQATPGALSAWMQSSSPANLAKLVAYES